MKFILFDITSIYFLSFILKSKKITFQKVRMNSINRGYIFQHHHDELDVMSVSGITAMAYHPTFGLTADLEVNSVAYDNWQKLLATFRNNGVNYSKTQDGLIDSVGRVSIKFDGKDYRGAFDELVYTMSQETPFHSTFSWTFTISETINNFVSQRSRLMNQTTLRGSLV